MADNRNLVLQLLITAKDDASAAFGKLFKFLNDETNVVAGKIRDAFSRLFAGGLDSAIEFEAQLDRVAAKGGYTGAEMDDLKIKTALLGSQFGVTGTEAAKGMEALAAAGLSAVDAIATLPPVLALAASEEISVDAAAQKLIDSLSIMGLGFDEAGRMADVLAKGANITTSSAAQLAEALTQAGGMARAAGLDLETTVAALDLLHKNGIKGAAAGTSLKGILTALLDPASTASVELNKLGISSRDLGSVMAALKDKGGVANAAILAFGQEAGPGLRALLGEGQTALDEMTLQLQNADGAAQAAADQMGGNLKSAMGSLNSAWDSLKAALLEPLLEPIAKAANELTAAFQGVLADGSIKGVQDLLKEFGTGIAEGIKKAIGSFDFKGATEAINNFADGAKGSFVVVEGAATAAAGAVKVAFNLITAPINAVMSSAFQTMGNLLELLSGIEAKAAKVGLGTLQKADELMGKANAAFDTARDLNDAAKQDVDDLTAGANKTTTAFDGVTGEMQKAREEAEKAKPPDLGNAETLTPIKKSLEDYVGLLGRAKIEQDKATATAADAEAQWLELGTQYDYGKISIDTYNAALDRHKAAQEKVKVANSDVAQSQRDVDVATQEAIRGIDKESIAVTAGIESKKSRYDANQKQLGIDQKVTEELTKLSNTLTVNAQAELALAKAKGDGNAIAEAQLKLIQNEITALQAKKEEQDKELAQLQTKSDRMQDLLHRQKILTVAEQAELELLKQQNPAIAVVIAAKETDIKTTDKQIETKEREKRQAEIMAGPVGELTRLYAEQAKEHERTAAASERYQESLTKEAEHTLKLAQLKGDSQEIDKAQSALDAQKIQDAQAIANAKKIAATDAENELSAMNLKLAADGELSKADKEQIATMETVSKAKRDAANASQESVTSLQEETQATKDAADKTQKAADAAKDAGDKTKEATKAVTIFSRSWWDLADAGNAAVDAVDEMAKQVKSVEGILSIAKAYGDLAGGFNEIADQEKEAAAAAKQLQGAWSQVESGTFQGTEQDLRNLVYQTQQAVNRTGEYGGSVTKAGEDAIAVLNDLRQKWQEVADTIAARNADLRAQLLELSGDKAAADKLRLEGELTRDLADAEKALAEARAAGNLVAIKAAEENIRLLTEIANKKTANIDLEARQAAANAKTSDANKNTTSSTNDLATALERAGTAANNLNSVNLSGLHSQVNMLGESVNRLRGAL